MGSWKSKSVTIYGSKFCQTNPEQNGIAHVAGGSSYYQHPQKTVDSVLVGQDSSEWFELVAWAQDHQNQRQQLLPS